jgi:hypothetical protein
MSKRVLVLIVVLLPVSGFTQETADIGIWGGASTYWGDMNEVDYIRSVSPLYGAFFRYNFNARYSVRMMYLTGNIRAAGRMENQTWEFGPKWIHTVALMAEINYLDYILGAKKTPISPYIMGGIGLTGYRYHFTKELADRLRNMNPLSMEVSMNSEWNDQKQVFDIFESERFIRKPSLLFGMGVKTHIGPRFGIAVECILQKLTDDRLDDLNDPLAYKKENKTKTYTDFIHNNDYTAYAGITLTYKIYMGRVICPAY